MANRRAEKPLRDATAKDYALLAAELGGGVLLYLAGPLILLAGFWNPVLWLLFIPLAAMAKGKR